jgi:hypothetical protein
LHLGISVPGLSSLSLSDKKKDDKQDRNAKWVRFSLVLFGGGTTYLELAYAAGAGVVRYMYCKYRRVVNWHGCSGRCDATSSMKLSYFVTRFDQISWFATCTFRKC